jgi:hypothetical protein
VPMLLGSNRDEGFMFLAEDPSEEVDISQPGEEGGGYGGGGRKNRHPFDVGALLAWVEANFGDGAARWGPGAARHAHPPPPPPPPPAPPAPPAQRRRRHRHHRHHRHQRSAAAATATAQQQAQASSSDASTRTTAAAL